jgi:hypothetical protein
VSTLIVVWNRGANLDVGRIFHKFVGNASTSTLVGRVQGLLELLSHIVREIRIPLMLLLDVPEMLQDLIGCRLVRQRVVADGDRGLDDLLLLHLEEMIERLKPAADNRRNSSMQDVCNG